MRDSKGEIEDASQKQDYAKILELFENKGMIKEVGRNLDLPGNGYSNYVVRKIAGGEDEGIMAALKELVPDLNSTL